MNVSLDYLRMKSSTDGSSTQTRMLLSLKGQLVHPKMKMAKKKLVQKSFQSFIVNKSQNLHYIVSDPQ